MTDIDRIIDKAIESVVLERDLGVRFFEIDRSLLEVGKVVSVVSDPVLVQKIQTKVEEPAPKTERAEQKSQNSKEKVYDFIFLHDRSLSEPSELFMEKALSGLGVSKEEAPLFLDKPLPSARVYVVMGLRALKKFAPGVSATMGAISTSPGGKRMVLTHSPEDMTRFASVTPAVVEMKKITWLGFKRAAAEAAKLKEGQ